MNALARRRQALLEECARQRASFSREARALEPAFAAADKGVAAFRYLARHPLIPAAAVAALAIWKPARVLSLARRGWLLWTFYRNARERLSGNG